MQIAVDDTNEPFAIKCCVTTQTKALLYIYWLLMIRLRKTGVTFGVKFLSRSSFFSSSSAHCLVFGFVCDWHLTLHLIICFVRQNVKTASTFLDFLNEQTTMRRLQITRDEFHQKKLSALLICVVIVRAYRQLVNEISTSVKIQLGVRSWNNVSLINLFYIALLNSHFLIYERELSWI